MTKYIFLFSSAVLFASCANEPAGSSDGKESHGANSAGEAGAHYFGDTITSDGAMTMVDFAKVTEGRDSLDAKVSCEIITSCKKKGCWMDVKMADGSPMKVRFKDYGFFVPTSGLQGKTAVIQGHASKEITDVGALKHYAEDAGKTVEEIEKITEPEVSWSFIADGVIIRD